MDDVARSRSRARDRARDEHVDVPAAHRDDVTVSSTPRHRFIGPSNCPNAAMKATQTS
jgi:hypothetical protein